MKARTLRRLLRTFDRPNDVVCWLWKGRLTTKGYGQFFADGARRQAHRVVYEMLVGPVPEGLVLDHLCRNRACVNLRHLDAVTSGENTHRGETIAAQNAAKTECPAGHPYDDANTIHRASGRICRMCKRAHNRARKRRARQLARPGQPSNWNGCPGDRPLDRIVERATDGLIAPGGTQ